MKLSRVISTFFSVVSCRAKSNLRSIVLITRYIQAHAILESNSVSYVSVVYSTSLTYFCPKQPNVPLEAGTRYFSSSRTFSGQSNQRSGMNLEGSGNISGSLRMKYVDMLIYVCPKLAVFQAHGRRSGWNHLPQQESATDGIARFHPAPSEGVEWSLQTIVAVLL